MTEIYNKNNIYYNFKNIKNFLNKTTIDSCENFFNKKYLKFGYFDNDGYLILNTMWHNNVFDWPDFTYKINKDGYRTKHFNKLEKNKINFLFNGCSFTFGEGLPEKYLWPSILINKKYKNKQNVNYYNISSLGSSIELIIKNTLSFIRKYGKPNYIFLCFPSISRKIIFDNKNQKYINSFPSTIWLNSNKQLVSRIEKYNEDPKNLIKIQKKYTIDYEYENNIVSQSILIFLLEDYCKKENIKLFWTTWDLRENYIYENLDFNNFFPIDFHHNQFLDSDKNNLPYFKIAKDGAHPGYLWNLKLSDFFSKII